ncbi:MAG TPA: SBBP repeat-containing protein, partial [Candidatus Paceibacterota bacterium]
WTANITLTAGVNTINIRATDSRNNIANTSVNVTYTPVASGETIFGMKTGGSDAFGYTTDIGNAIAIDTRDNCDGQGGKNCMIVGGNKGIAFMEKYTSTGQLVWGGVMSGGGDVREIQLDSQGNIYIVGSVSGFLSFSGGTILVSAGGNDVFVAKFSEAGVLQWAKKYGSTFLDSFVVEESGEGVAVDANGNVYVSGYNSYYPIDFGCAVSNTSSSFLIKLNPQGICDWVKVYPGTTNYVNDVVLDTNGNIYITGSFTGTVDFGGGSVTALNTLGNGAFFVAKYNSVGSYQWMNQYALGNEPYHSSRGYSLFIDSFGNLYATGAFGWTQSFGGSTTLTSYGANDIILVKYRASDGAHIWSKKLGGLNPTITVTLFESGYGVASDPSGNIYVTGEAWNTPVDVGMGTQTSLGTGRKILISSFDSNGNFRWGKTVAASKGLAIPYALSMDSFGNPVIAGRFWGIMDLGGIILESDKNGTNYSMDIFIWKLAK